MIHRVDAKLHHSCGDWYKVASPYCHVTHASGSCMQEHTPGSCINTMRENKSRTGIIWSVQPRLTFSNNLLDSDLVSPHSEASSNEISACMTGPGAAAASSRTRPGADQLPTRIKELPHVVQMAGGVFAASVTETQEVTECPPPPLRAVIYCTNAGQIVNLTSLTLRASLFAASKHAVMPLSLTMMWRQPRFLVANFPFACQHEPVDDDDDDS